MHALRFVSNFAHRWTRFSAVLLVVGCCAAAAASAASVLTPEQIVQAGAATVQAIREAPALPLVQTNFMIKPPTAGWELGAVSSLAFGQDGLLYLLQRGAKADPIVVVDAGGNVVRSWGKGLFELPHYIRVDSDGNVWTTDAHSSVVYKFTPEGVQLLKIEVGGQVAGPSPFVGITDIAFCPDGRLFVSDGYANARVVEYTAAGHRVREWGVPGIGPGEFNLPHAIVCDASNVLYVADRENGRIQRFDPDGRFLSEWSVGKTYSLKLAGGALWAGVHGVDQPTGSPGWLVKLDRRTGKILSVVAVAEPFSMHAVEVDRDGQPLTTAKSGVLWFRPR
jgi:streptogramin lyase